MRKVLLASTALVALGSVSAMAADVTISGSHNLLYKSSITMAASLVQLNVHQSRFRR